MFRIQRIKRRVKFVFCDEISKQHADGASDIILQFFIRNLDAKWRKGLPFCPGVKRLAERATQRRR